MTPTRFVAVLCALATAPAASASALAAQPPQAAHSPSLLAGAAVTRLSDLRALSRWAFPLAEAPVRTGPAESAHVLGRLRFLTGDSQAELYLALRSARLPSGATWLEIELPGRPNGMTGWVPASQLGPLNVVRDSLFVDRTHLRITLYRRGRTIFSAPVGVGKPRTATPAGNFYVMEKLTTLGAPFYGPYAIGTSAYAPSLSEWPGGGVVGIHGTDQPQLIPGRPSHGCVRMRNGDITRLWHMLALGTPIRIV